MALAFVAAYNARDLDALQEWMGHRNLATTEIYADYAPDPAYGAAFAESAFTAKPAHDDAKKGEEAQKNRT